MAACNPPHAFHVYFDLLYFVPAAANVSALTLIANFSGETFLDDWDFFSEDDPTHVRKRLPGRFQCFGSRYYQ